MKRAILLFIVIAYAVSWTIGWIAQAKRPETRARRIAQSVERLAAGRKLFD
jgi:uncharacterized protein YdeI (YjbR/CyaY-like superfamily)